MEVYKILDKEKIELCTYGMELLLSSATGVLALVLVSVCIRKPLLWLPYLSGFVALRLSGGGYHAKTHKECIIKFTSMYVIFIILSRYLCNLDYFPVITSFLVLMITLYCSPVEAGNKPLKSDVYKINRRKSVLLSTVNYAVSLILVNYNMTDNLWIVSYYAGYAFAGLSMIYSAINKKERDK